MKDAILSKALSSPQKVIDGIMSELSLFAKDGDLQKHNGKFTDDVSIMVIKKK